VQRTLWKDGHLAEFDWKLTCIRRVFICSSVVWFQKFLIHVHFYVLYWAVLVFYIFQIRYEQLEPTLQQLTSDPQLYYNKGLWTNQCTLQESSVYSDNIQCFGFFITADCIVYDEAYIASNLNNKNCNFLIELRCYSKTVLPELLVGRCLLSVNASVTELLPRPSVSFSVCLSVHKVYCGKAVEWIRMPFLTEMYSNRYAHASIHHTDRRRVNSEGGQQFKGTVFGFYSTGGCATFRRVNISGAIQTAVVPPPYLQAICTGSTQALRWRVRYFQIEGASVTGAIQIASSV